MDRNRKQYTQDELDYIANKWGIFSAAAIAKHLGREESAIRLKGIRMGLGDPRLATEDVTLVMFCDLSGISYRTIRSWIDNREFPVKKKTFVKKTVRMVSFKEFWKWAESRKEMLDLTKFEKGDLGLEPEWADIKRRDDFSTMNIRRKKHNDPWTKSEDGQLKFLVECGNYTYPEIAYQLGRGEGAIKRRLEELKVKLRPIRLDNHKKYTAEEEKVINDGIAAGRSIESIAYEIGRSALGVRGKLERMGYKFVCGVPYLPDPEREVVKC